MLNLKNYGCQYWTNRNHKVFIVGNENILIIHLFHAALYQVAASILDPAAFAREIAPLKKVSDHYPKFIISMDELPMSEDGIRQVNIVYFKNME